MNKRVGWYIVLLCGLIVLLFAGLLYREQTKTFVLRNDLPYSTVTRLHVERSFISKGFSKGQSTYFVYPILLEPTAQQTVFGGGKSLCVAVNRNIGQGGFVVPTGTTSWLLLDLPWRTEELPLSRLSEFARKPCPHFSLSTYQEYPLATSSTGLSNVFNPLTNKIGDQVAGLTVSALSGVPGIDRPIALDNVYAKFTGRVVLSGIYLYSYNDFAGMDMVCFQVSDSDKSKLPALVGQPDQNGLFCFKDTEKAKKMFGPEYGRGNAVVTIDHYELYYAPAEVVNQAELISGRRQ